MDILGAPVIYICMGLDFVIGAGFYVIRLASAKWKKKIIVKEAPEEAAENA